MISCIVIVIILVLLVLLGLLFWGYFRSGNDISPISKDGKRIDELDLDSAIKTLKENGFKQSDTDIKHILAISYIFSSMKKEDLKDIASSLSKTGSQNTLSKDAIKTNEDPNKPKTKETINNSEAVDKMDTFNKGFKVNVFGKDGVKKNIDGH